MKRTPLTRRVGLRRSGPLVRRTPLKPARKEKLRWKRKYAKALSARKAEQIETRGATFCERCLKNSLVDGHHPGGQQDEKIMLFVLVCRACHNEIHGHMKASRREGWAK